MTTTIILREPPNLCSTHHQQLSLSLSSSSVVLARISSSYHRRGHHQVQYHHHHQEPPKKHVHEDHGSATKKSLIIRRREAMMSTGGLGLHLLLGGGGIIVDNAIILEQPQAAEASTSTSTTANCEFTVTPSGLQFCDQVIGTGPEPTKGQLIKAHYVGKLENGKIFDSSYSRGKPLTFRVGIGEVIKGWDQGILGDDGIPPMHAGGKRSLKLPSELGYGMRGAGCKLGGSCIIPPESTLLFDVEFIGKA